MQRGYVVVEREREREEVSKKEKKTHSLNFDLFAFFPPAARSTKQKQQERLSEKLSLRWRNKIKFGNANGASTGNNTTTGAGREIDNGFGLLFLDGKVCEEWNPMDRHLSLGPRLESDHSMLAGLLAQKCPEKLEKELAPVRTMLARLSASAASYSAAALQKLMAEKGCEAKVEEMRRKTVTKVYEGMSIVARGLVHVFLAKRRELRAQEKDARAAVAGG